MKVMCPHRECSMCVAAKIGEQRWRYNCVTDRDRLDDGRNLLIYQMNLWQGTAGFLGSTFFVTPFNVLQPGGGKALRAIGLVSAGGE
jgi:hypothetical protein